MGQKSGQQNWKKKILLWLVFTVCHYNNRNDFTLQFFALFHVISCFTIPFISILFLTLFIQKRFKVYFSG